MMKYLQKLGKSLMLPVACLPVASILMGIGYWIDPNVMSGLGEPSTISAILVKAGGALIDNMAILFAIGVGVGMSDDNDGTSGLAGLVSWLVITTLLMDKNVALFRHVDIAEVPAAFTNIKTQFIGILAGIIGATCYNRFKNTKLPDFLGFFSGKRCVAIVTAASSLVTSIILYFIWPIIYGGLVKFGEMIMSTGAIGAGIYGFLNRLLIPIGLHHALNSVFWFNIAGIDDIAKFFGTAPGGEMFKTGIYMSGFFPIMMFGLPAAALAMYHTAKDSKKKAAAGMLFALALSSFFTGVTEPMEFSFMFIAPVLYVIHAVLTGITMAIVALIPARAGFFFSAGFVDWFLSFKAPFAMKPWLLLIIGIGVGAVYYIIFRFVITKLNLKTIGREDDDKDAEMSVKLANNDYTTIASIVMEGLGGKDNITSVDNCVTRLRLEIKDYTKIDEKKIKSAGVAGIIRPSKTAVQVIIGTQVQFVADEFKKLWK